MECEILIVGAGPTGLVLALWLAKSGIRLRIIDKNNAPGEASRAMAVHARTLEFYRQLGIADAVVQGGIITDRMCIRKGGAERARVELKDIGKGISPYPFVLSYPQDDHEKLLVEKLKALGVEVERGTELLDFTQSERGVQATIRTGSISELVEAHYICGCDGAHSAVRICLGEEFQGATYKQVFYVADAEVSGEVWENSINVCVRRQDFCLALPVRSSGTMRLIGLVPKEHEHKEQITWEDVASSAQATTALKVETLNWFSIYHVHHRVANAFQKYHAFLLGDAAHIHSPAGGQGMNTGIGDAVNLAWKLASVLRGHASPEILATYSAERIPFAHRLVKSTDRLFQIMASRSWVGVLGREIVISHIMPFVLRLHVGARFMFRTVSQTAIRYPKSALSSGKAGNIQGGDRLPWVEWGGVNNFAPLASLTWQAHVYGKIKAPLAEAAQRLGLPLSNFAWSEAARKAGLARDALYLVRPDGYVALADRAQDPLALERFLARFQLVFR